MKEVYKRTITGAVIVAVIVCSLISGPYIFFILCCSVNVVGLFEFYRLFEVTKSPVLLGAGLILSVSLFITAYLFQLGRPDSAFVYVSFPIISFIFVAMLFIRTEGQFSSLAFVFLGLVYVTFPFILLFFSPFILNRETFNANIVLGYFFFLWANDSGAYITGSLFGKTPLAPVISPKKTWEGSAGGALLVVAFVFINHELFKDLSLINWFVVGFFVIVMGTAGDLVKSAMKRSRNVKDSGKVLPGHGGILDRFDSLIGSILFVYPYLSFLN